MEWSYKRARHFGCYEVVLKDGTSEGYVRRDPHRLHLSLSKTHWQNRRTESEPWSGAFETRDQAARYLLSRRAASPQDEEKL